MVYAFTVESGISKYSQSVLDSLSQYCDVDLWVSQNENLLDTRLDVYHYNCAENMAQRLHGYDLVIYNLGDHMPFHKDIYETSRQVKGLSLFTITSCTISSRVTILSIRKAGTNI